MKFSYRAKKGPSDVLKGEVEAANYRAAVDEVLRLGLTPVEVRPAGEGSLEKSKSVRIPEFLANIFSFHERFFQTDVVLLTRYLSDFLGAGVPVLRSLQLIRKYFSTGRMVAALDDIIQGVESGESLSVVMGKLPSIFSEMYINMIYAGEMSGSLEETIERLADFLEHDQEDRMKIISSLIYPCLILVAGFATLFILFTWFIPNIMSIFDEMDQAIPLITRVLMGVSAFFSKFWVLLLLIIIMVPSFFIRWYKTSEGRMIIDRKLFFAPWIGRFIRQVAVARFTRTLGTLLKGGVEVVPALGYAIQVISNRYIQDQLKQSIDHVAGGKPLSRAFAQGSVFTDADTSMISVGEETGALSIGLLKLADFYDKSNDRIIKTMTTMIEPIFILGLGAVIGLVVMAMMMPIFQMNLVIN